MKILLTGSSGFLGSQIIKNLPDHKIITVGRIKTEVIADLTVDIPHIDFADLIIHAAGKAHSVPKTDREIEEFHRMNVTGTYNLLKGIENAKALPFAFVFISSVAVYGAESGINISENSPLDAKDPYGKSKIKAEQIVSDWCIKNNVICTILRLPLIAGPNPPGNLGAMIKGIKKGYYFNIAGGKAKKSIVLAEDVAKIILIACKIGGIYNLTDGYHPSFKELSFMIARQLNKKPPLNLPGFLAKLIALAGDVLGNKAPLNSQKLTKITSNLIFNDAKARDILGWKPGLVLDNFKIS